MKGRVHRHGWGYQTCWFVLAETVLPIRPDDLFFIVVLVGFVVIAIILGETQAFVVIC
jgi:hypothetical protein